MSDITNQSVSQEEQCDTETNTTQGNSENDRNQNSDWYGNDNSCSFHSCFVSDDGAAAAIMPSTLSTAAIAAIPSIPAKAEETTSVRYTNQEGGHALIPRKERTLGYSRRFVPYCQDSGMNSRSLSVRGRSCERLSCRDGTSAAVTVASTSAYRSGSILRTLLTEGQLPTYEPHCQGVVEASRVISQEEVVIIPDTPPVQNISERGLQAVQVSVNDAITSDLLSAAPHLYPEVIILHQQDVESLGSPTNIPTSPAINPLPVLSPSLSLTIPTIPSTIPNNSDTPSMNDVLSTFLAYINTTMLNLENSVLDAIIPQMQLIHNNLHKSRQTANKLQNYLTSIVNDEPYTSIATSIHEWIALIERFKMRTITLEELLSYLNKSL